MNTTRSNEGLDSHVTARRKDRGPPPKKHRRGGMGNEKGVSRGHRNPKEADNAPPIHFARNSNLKRMRGRRNENDNEVSSEDEEPLVKKVRFETLGSGPPSSGTLTAFGQQIQAGEQQAYRPNSVDSTERVSVSNSIQAEALMQATTAHAHSSALAPFELQKHKNEHEDQFDDIIALKKQIVALAKDKIALKKDKAELQTKLAALEKDNTELNKNVTACKAEADFWSDFSARYCPDIKDQSGPPKSALHNVTQIAVKAKQKVTELHSAIGDLKLQITQLEAGAVESGEEITSLKARIAELEFDAKIWYECVDLQMKDIAELKKKCGESA